MPGTIEYRNYKIRTTIQHIYLRFAKKKPFQYTVLYRYNKDSTSVQYYRFVFSDSYKL